MDLTTYIKHPEQLDATAVKQLERLVETYPFFQAARLLWIRGLYQLQDEGFGQELRKTALCIPDRSTLFELIEGDKFQPSSEQKQKQVPKQAEPAQDRTQSLIDSFLSQLPEDSQQKRRPRPVDASVDYMGYLMQTENETTMPPLPEKRRQRRAESDDENSGRYISQNAVAEDDDLLPLGLEENDRSAPSEAFFTETLAQIYIKQGKYSKAIEIIRRLSLNFPKKNRYFADQIRFLEKLLLNEQGKKTLESGSEEIETETN